ncbi:hypothetical protein Tco_0366798 [Tanacetum coccineum]
MQRKTSRVGSDTRPPMLDRTDFESWQQRIRLYCLGKDNGENIMKSIKEGPFHMGTVSDVIAGGTEGAVQQGPVRARVLNDLSAEEKERYKADIRATNILLQGETIQGYYVRFTKLINDMRNIKMTMPRMQLNSKFVNNMLPEWSRFITEVKLNRGLKESNFDQLYAYLKQHEVHANENRIMMERFIQPNNDPLALEQSLVQDGGSCVQDVRGRYNATNQGRPFQRNNARGNGVAEMDIDHVNVHAKADQDSDYFKDKMLLMQAQESGAVLDEEQSLFLAGEQVTNVDNDVDDSPENDLALNVDHVFEADECDAFDSDVDEGPITQTMFMANLTSEDPIYDEAGPSYDSNNPFEVQDHDTFVDHMDEYHEVHEMQNDVQHNYVVDSDADYTSDSNIIPYDQYVEDNEEHVVQCNVSSVRNDALMSILDEMHEHGIQSRLVNKPDIVVNDLVTSELARYKELVGEYEKQAKKETSLKSELHSAQILLSSTVDHFKSKTEEVTCLKKDFKQKEDKFLEEFLDIKKLKDKIEDRLYKQDQFVQTVHMLCKPKSFYDEKHKVAIGYKNPLCLTRAKQAQSVLYSGHVLVTTNHAPTVIHDSEDTREIAEITRKRMLLKMQSPLYVENKVRIAPPPPSDYSKENLLATFSPQRNLTPEQIFWSIDENERKKVETSVPKPLSALTVYLPNTPVKLVPRVLPTLFKIVKRNGMKNLITIHNKVNKNTVDKQCAEIEKKNLLIENENLIVNCLSTQLLYDVEKSRCLDLEADMSKVHDESPPKLNSKLEREY